MNKLPVVPNKCRSECGECCNGMVPMTGSDMRRIFEYMTTKMDPEIKRRILRKERSLKTCPFLSDDKRCLVYEVRPTICEGYGYVQSGMQYNMVCPYQGDGVLFESWSPERVKRFETKLMMERQLTGWGLTSHAMEEFRKRYGDEDDGRE